MEDKKNNNTILINCRHCETGNEINKKESMNSLDNILCKNCGKNLLLDRYSKFEKISSINYEHPMEKNALNTLRAIPGLEQTMKNILKNFTDRYFKTYFLQNFLKVSENNLKSIHEKVIKISEIFDLDYIPETFIVQRSPFPNSYIVGIDRGIIGITASMINEMNDKELDGILAHEISHIKSNHMLFKTLANIAGTVGVTVAALSLSLGAGLPNLSQFIAMPVRQALSFWDRTSELSADRAELLVTRDYKQFVKNQLKLSSGMPKNYQDEINLEEYEKQVDEVYKIGGENVFDKMTMMFQESNESHPFPVWRIGAIREWLMDDEFYNIIQGNYIKTTSGKTETENGNEKKIENDFEKFLNDVKNFFGF
jgi:Zn-dependent protease with chaperone function